MRAVIHEMRKFTLGAVTLLTACSSNTLDDEWLESQGPLGHLKEGQEAESDPTQMDPAAPIDLPYVERGDGCAVQEGCDGVEVYSSVSPEESRARLATRAIREFQANEVANWQLYSEVTDRALATAAALVDAGQGDAMQPVTLYLPEQFFDFGQLVTADAETHARLWRERTDQLAGSQQRAIEVAEQLGGKAKGAIQLTNVVYVDTPARSIEALVRSGILEGLEISGPPPVPDAEGIARREGLSMTPTGFQGLGWDGNQGGKRDTAGPVLVAVIEASGTNNNLNPDYLGWFEGEPPNSSTPSTSRLLNRYYCNGASCATMAFTARPFNVPPTNMAGWHGTAVASTLLADFEDNQAQYDPVGQTWFSVDRRQRGGIASEAEFVYYATVGTSDVTAAINHAVSANVDIINMSLSFVGSFCANATLDGARAAIAAATNSGVLVVVSAGNLGDLGATCRVNSYGAVPDSFVVGGVADITGLASLDTVGIMAMPGTPTTYSGTGANGETTTIAGGAVVPSRPIDIAATGVVDLVGDANFTDTSSWTGTSFSAPQVSGAAAVLKDWILSTGAFGGQVWRYRPYTLAVMLATMGDGSWGFNGNFETAYQIDQVTGFGHLRFAPPSPELLGDMTYAHSHVYPPRDDLDEGDDFEFYVGNSSGPEPVQVTGWKFAALIDADFYGHTPAISFELIDKCPAGGGVVVVRPATLATHKARIRMRATDMATKYHNRCLWVRGHVDQADDPFTLYMADYAYTKSRKWHDMTVTP